MTNAAANRTTRSRFGDDRRVTCLRFSSSPAHAPNRPTGARGAAPRRHLHAPDATESAFPALLRPNLGARPSTSSAAS